MTRTSASLTPADRQAADAGPVRSRAALSAPMGNQAHLRRLVAKGQPLQAKLTIGAVDDPLEREADAAADQVMRMADPQVSQSSAGPALNRKCAACEEEDKPVMREAAGPGMAGEAAPSVVHQVLDAPGHALDPGTHDFMANRFGADFSDVRIHTDGRAAASADAVHAHAYTVGADVVFGAGQYRPDTGTGRRLIAHELAHVVQQGGATGAGTVARRAPAAPVTYDTGAQTFGPPAAGVTLASIKADIAAKQAKTPNPDLGPTVDVKGVAPGTAEELYVWNVLNLRGERQNWGAEVQVVTAIGPKPATPPDAKEPVGEVTIVIDKAGNATAELLDKGPVAVPANFADKDKAVEALKGLGFSSVDNGTASWTPEELNKVYAAISQMPAADRAGLSGVKLVRDATLVNAKGEPLDGEFRASHSVTAGAPAAAGSPATPSVASQDASLHLATSAFSADATGFVGEKGKEVLPSLRVIQHEAGHAEETKALRDAQFTTDTAQAAANNDTFALGAENTNTNTAVGAANAASTPAFAKANAYKGDDRSGSRAFVTAFQAAVGAVNTYANNTTGSSFAALETAAQKVIAARDAAKTKVPAGNPALSDFATAVTTQDAWFAQAQVRAKASLKLDASKKDFGDKKKAQDGVSDKTGKTSKRLESFVAVVNKNNIPRFTKYAKDNWPDNPDEFFAEAYSLWLSNPGYLNDNAPALKAWFDAGEHLK